MPNLMQQLVLKDQYSELDYEEILLEDYYRRAAKSADNISKGFDLNGDLLLEHLNISNDYPKLIEYFESKPTENVALLFIDIANFSKITVRKDNEFTTRYLDSYYKQAIPIIYENDGQIEKLMGDGIICVFGSPFTDGGIMSDIVKAETCAQEIINKFKGTNKEVKVALHSGEITYYKTPGIDYQEYTMIGKPLTELFRLESVARTNAINYYDKAFYSAMRTMDLTMIKKELVTTYQFKANLQGVEYDVIEYLKLK